ncbi:hypothetical protein GCM10020366_70290 [Saccharopolyspora gregorii]|uniref:Uncharacterized protein n=1 Tax=Saccharopolyspora gregorii TaxID=33914 RepID=A0ABP6S2K9_9PSEU
MARLRPPVVGVPGARPGQRGGGEFRRGVLAAGAGGVDGVEHERRGEPLVVVGGPGGDEPVRGRADPLGDLVGRVGGGVAGGQREAPQRGEVRAAGLGDHVLDGEGDLLDVAACTQVRSNGNTRRSSRCTPSSASRTLSASTGGVAGSVINGICVLCG